MSNDLLILAGKTAYEQIRENGLSPDDISLVLGASGAAKWLVLYGLDSAIFSDWFKGRQEPLHLLGTSIGAWKFAAAAQTDPRAGFDTLKQAYIHQFYKGRITPDKVTRESRRIMDVFLPDDRIREVLANPVFRIGFGAVRCKGLLASKVRLFQVMGMWSGFELNLLSRHLQRYCYERMIFHHGDYDTGIADFSDFPTGFVPLDRANFMKALLASASIPFIMAGVDGVPGAPKGMYRDGGLLDYHPAFALSDDRDGLILYPHFYPHIIPGWFDKKLGRRRAAGPVLDRTILLAPSPAFVATLPFGRIPDRKDFVRLQGRDDERVAAWETAAGRSLKLGTDFLEAVSSGRIRELVKPLG